MAEWFIRDETLSAHKSTSYRRLLMYLEYKTHPGFVHNLLFFSPNLKLVSSIGYQLTFHGQANHRCRTNGISLYKRHLPFSYFAWPYGLAEIPLRFLIQSVADLQPITVLVLYLYTNLTVKYNPKTSLEATTQKARQQAVDSVFEIIGIVESSVSLAAHIILKSKLAGYHCVHGYCTIICQNTTYLLSIFSDLRRALGAKLGRHTTSIRITWGITKTKTTGSFLEGFWVIKGQFH